MRFTLHALAGVIAAGFALAPAAAHEGHDAEQALNLEPAPPPHAMAQFRALAGEWIAAEDTPNFKQGDVVSRYELTGGGTTLIDRLFPGAQNEMTTLYHADGEDVVLTHYCASGRQTRMRAAKPAADAALFEFAFDGGTNLDASKHSHMHSARVQLVSADELIGDWQSWSEGKPDGPPMRFHLLRKK